MKSEKTNVMRLLDKAKIKYAPHEYPHGSEAVDGLTVAKLCGFDPECVFKTLVARGTSKNVYVFVIPVSSELDLKKAAKAVGEKSVEMIKSKDLLPLTGYIHGGCSPIGMKKFFKTTVHYTAADYDTIFFSGGRIGFQIELDIEDLGRVIEYKLEDITKEDRV